MRRPQKGIPERNSLDRRCQRGIERAQGRNHVAFRGRHIHSALRHPERLRQLRAGATDFFGTRHCRPQPPPGSPGRSGLQSCIGTGEAYPQNIGGTTATQCRNGAGAFRTIAVELVANQHLHRGHFRAVGSVEHRLDAPCRHIDRICAHSRAIHNRHVDPRHKAACRHYSHRRSGEQQGTLAVVCPTESQHGSHKGSSGRRLGHCIAVCAGKIGSYGLAVGGAERAYSVVGIGEPALPHGDAHSAYAFGAEAHRRPLLITIADQFPAADTFCQLPLPCRSADNPRAVAAAEGACGLARQIRHHHHRLVGFGAQHGNAVAGSENEVAAG